MDHSVRVFGSVFPVLSFSHTTPTPIATPDLGYVAPDSPLGGSRTARRLGTPSQIQHRAVRRAVAWSCATRFLSIPYDINTVAKPPKTVEVDEALSYLFLGEGKCDNAQEEDLDAWYLNECKLHFANHIQPQLAKLWQRRAELTKAWDVLDRTRRILECAQQMYIRPFNDHIVPYLQQDASIAAPADKLYRDIHTAFTQSIPSDRFSNSLSFILYNSGCQLFHLPLQLSGRLRDMPTTSPSELRKKMIILLQGLEHVGLGRESAQRDLAHAMNKLLNTFIASHYLKVDWRSRTSVVPHLKMWIMDGFCPFVELVLDCLKCEQSTISPTEMSSWQEMALNRLGRARLQNLFEYAINWDASWGAILDIKEYLKITGAKQYLTSQFAQQVSTRLLHPGATTTYILNVYISIIRAFYELEPKGVLLERVARPIRRYLKEREDTARIIISSLLTDVKYMNDGMSSSNTELSYEIASEMAKPFANHARDLEDDSNWGDLSWQPLPQDASPDYKKSKAEDVIWFLLTLLDREDFINELRNILGDHLLRNQDPEYEREIRLLELIRLRLGDDKLQACEVMLRDVLDSKSINASIHAIGNDLPHASSEFTLDTQILSSFFWPLLRNDKYRIPPEIDVMQKEYESCFERIKGMRKLRWMNALGVGAITLHFEDRTEDFENLTPWQVSVVHTFQPQNSEKQLHRRTSTGEGISRTIGELRDILEMDEALVRQALAFWVGKSVLREVASDTYAVIESLSCTRADDEAVAAAEEMAAVQAAQTSTVKSQSELLDENRGIYTAFIVGMLTNQGNMSTENIAMMMRIMIQGGFPFGVEEVRTLLIELESAGQVLALGGDTWGAKK